MKTIPTALSLAILLPLTPGLEAQELSPRMGLGAFFTQPTDSGGKLYASGWKVNLAIHVRREALVEGRVRLEFGEFREGKEVFDWGGAAASRYSARTRLVGYDWLIPLGTKQATGLDLILGLGGAHWFRQSSHYSLPGNAYPFAYYSSSGDELAFAGTLGLRYRLARNFELEIHQVFTSTPRSDKDFSDGELSHTSLGLSFRF
jgi:hypothetical protein